MENASKALIIAGAILLAILLISLGILIFSQAQDTVDNSGMGAAELQTFNNRLVKYEGKKKEASVVKNMLTEIMAINAEGTYKITLTSGSVTGANLTSTSWVETSKRYDVDFTYDVPASDSDTGTSRIKAVKITVAQ